MFQVKRFELLLLIALLGCKAQQGSSLISTDKLNGKIESKLGTDITKLNNYDSSYVLAFREDNSSGTLVVRYGVWVIKSGDLLYAGTAMRGSVAWLDNTSLLVKDYPGIMEEENSNYTFKIDLNTKIKTPLHEKKDL